jgi:hypothetical protein
VSVAVLIAGAPRLRLWSAVGQAEGEAAEGGVGFKPFECLLGLTRITVAQGD